MKLPAIDQNSNLFYILKLHKNNSWSLVFTIQYSPKTKHNLIYNIKIILNLNENQNFTALSYSCTTLSKLKRY